MKCKKRFTTYEKVGDIELKVIKRSGKAEDYKREKLERCLEKACWKLSFEERNKIIDEIEMRLLNWPSVEIPSVEIGKIILELLKELDAVAYIRFATIYQKVQSVDEFENLVKNFKREKCLKKK